MSARSFVLNKKSQGNIMVHSYDDGSILVNLHGHTVAALNAQGDITLSSCGYHTATTKVAINRFLSLIDSDYKVVQIKGN